jgi:NAD-dependent dihydropyrimidine dehydrogenase PreA subunit
MAAAKFLCRWFLMSAAALAAGLSLAVAQSDDDDLLLLDEDAALEEEEEAPAEEKTTAQAAHEALFLEDRFPSANTCAGCHPRQYRQWSVSSHAYAQLSPMMVAFQNSLNLKNSNTNGDFCLRCHAPTGTALGEPLSVSNYDRSPASREGVTCVTCHRVTQNFGKITGRYPIEQGDIYAPVYNSSDGEALSEVLAQPEVFRVQPERGKSGRAIHAETKPFFTLAQPAFCGGVCHEVTSAGGFLTHEMLTEYKRSPAAKRGDTCIDCHMGKVQGVKSEFDYGPAAVVGGAETKPRRLANHFFAGPDYSIIHPGIFPHNVEASQLKTLREWAQFDYKAGWGEDEFESAVGDDYAFPPAWESADDRFDARAILNDQAELLEWARQKRLEVLQNGFDLSDIRVNYFDDGGLGFEVDVKNITDGHHAPSGFDIERTVFLQVTVTDENGVAIYKSGDRDPNGDLRDRHAKYVQHGLVERDDDLFNLHSKVYAGIVRGPERPQILPPPLSRIALPMVRPPARAVNIYGRPGAVRKHRTGIPPLQHRTAKYRVGGDALGDGRQFDIDIKLIFQPLPVSLIYQIQGAGFDYGMSPKEVADNLVAGVSVVRHLRATIKRGGTHPATTRLAEVVK